MILIVDDDPSITTSLALVLKQHGHSSLAARNPDEALAILAANRPELVIQDMNFSRSTSGEEGLELLAQIREREPELPVILITAWGSIELAVEGMKRGARDFITKPWSNPQVVSVIETTLSLAKAGSSAVVPSRRDLEARISIEGVVGSSRRLLDVLERVSRVAPTDAAVLITGESGTGKELIAEAIHRNSRRRDGAFVKVNLGGISSTLFESEMFGHVRGAFTDARENRKGRFEIADRGTIFLDEVGEIDLNSQVKLLRVLQDRTYEVLGSSRTRTVDVRIVSATNRPLPELVRAGAFREDLFYRLNLITIEVPPLRERIDDVPALASHFADLGARTHGRPAVRIDDTGMRWLQMQSWPGNIRELRQTIERAILLCDGERLDARDLEAVAGHASAGPPGLPVPGSMRIGEMERAMIERTLAGCDGNVSRAAEALGLSRQALYRRLEKYGIEVKP